MSSGIVTMAHGGGGRAETELIEQEILSRFGDGPLAGLPDGARLPGGLVFSTDSFVVTPRFFPGGDIGKLAVCGTVNDLYMAGGTPRYLSLSLIIEEGFPREELGRILDSAAAAAKACGVSVATGDTKVVPRGGADGIYLNTAGIGIADPRWTPDRSRFRPGDRILVNGGIGEHGMAILAARHGIGGEGIVSDCAGLGPFVEAALAVAPGAVKFMRDPTRGGVGAVVQEMMSGSPAGAELREADLPLRPAFRALGGMLGIEPLFVACEGRMVTVADADGAEAILAAWRSLPGGESAAEIGELTGTPGRVTLRGEWGGRRLLIVPDGEQLPRIC